MKVIRNKNMIEVFDERNNSFSLSVNEARKLSTDLLQLGIEIEGTFSLANRWTWQPNLTLSRNRNHDFYFLRDGVLSDLGDTHLSFSPAMVAGNILVFQPSTQWKMALLTKYVGEQYMGNIDAQASKLKPIQYQI